MRVPSGSSHVDGDGRRRTRRAAHGRVRRRRAGRRPRVVRRSARRRAHRAAASRVDVRSAPTPAAWRRRAGRGACGRRPPSVRARPGPTGSSALAPSSRRGRRSPSCCCRKWRTGWRRKSCSEASSMTVRVVAGEPGGEERRGDRSRARGVPSAPANAAGSNPHGRPSTSSPTVKARSSNGWRGWCTSSRPAKAPRSPSATMASSGVAQLGDDHRGRDLLVGAHVVAVAHHEQPFTRRRAPTRAAPGGTRPGRRGRPAAGSAR